MGVFTFVCRYDGKGWNAKQHNGTIEATAASAYELQRKLVRVATVTGFFGGVQSSFSYVTPSSSVFQVIIGGGGGGGAPTTAPGGGAPAKEAPPVEEKKEEKEEETSDDDDMIMNLFD